MRPTVAIAALLTLGAVPAASGAPDPARADAEVRAFIVREGIPAAHVTVLRGDSVLLQRGYGSTVLDDPKGPAPTASSIFPLGSISKQFTAALIGALADQGKVQLDAPVGRYLPEWFADEPALRVRHLLNQTSGLADFLWLEGYRKLADEATTPLASYVALAAAAPRRYAPGTRWSYSNTNYKALALIAERVTGRAFDSLLPELVLRPAGIDGIEPCHDLRPDQYVPGISSEGKPAPLDASRAAYAGDGGLCGHAEALAQWIRHAFSIREGKAPGLERLLQPTRLADGETVPYGWGVSTREFLGRAMTWHGGNVDSHSTMIAYLPEEDLSLVILVNRGFVWLTELMPALIGAAPPARGAASGPPLSGRFEDGLFTYVITPDGGNMRVEIDLIGPLYFVPAGRGEYVAEQYPATFRIRLPTDGTRERFVIDWGEVRSYARRAAEQ
jgi:CubicO group peptidase (beta-lactamase class C family)